jgi:hypothetical protein
VVDLLDHRQDAAGIDVGQPSRHQHGVLFLGDEAPHQMLGQDADELLHGLDALVAGFLEPAPQAFQRPHVAEPAVFSRISCVLAITSSGRSE